MGKRKAWEQLSDAYRKRLQRGGITKQSHAQGRSLPKARGHTSRQYEIWRRHQRNIERFAAEYAEEYSFSASASFTPPTEEEILDELKHLSMPDARAAMNLQRKMQRAYDKGYRDRAASLYDRRDKRLPAFMHYYHGVFH